MDLVPQEGRKMIIAIKRAMETEMAITKKDGNRHRSQEGHLARPLVTSVPVHIER
jgi:hypothetical protein